MRQYTYTQVGKPIKGAHNKLFKVIGKENRSTEEHRHDDKGALREDMEDAEVGEKQ